METFGDRLESLRGSASQKDFAHKLGVPLTSYTNWVGGTSSPKMEYIIMLCTKLGVSADWLLGLSASPPAQPSRKVDDLKKAIITLLKEY